MSLGEKLLSFRKKKGLSQEEVAELLCVTRQTISKWETDQSTPDFDKIIPICELYNISTEELFYGEGETESFSGLGGFCPDDVKYYHRKAIYTTIAVMLYILSIVVIIFFSVVVRSPILGVCLFFLVIAIATGMLIYIDMIKPISITDHKVKRQLTKEERLYKQITNILALIILFIYLIVSILTMAWAITWILWIVYALLAKIIKLCFSLKGVEIYEED